MSKKINAYGFTIVELLVVIVVIGILAAVTIVSYSGIQERAVAAAIQAQISSSSQSLRLYYVDHGVYPASLDSNGCPSAPVVDGRYCVKNVSGGSLVYSGDNTTYNLTITYKGLTYKTKEDGVLSQVIPYSNMLSALTPATISTGNIPLGITSSDDGKFIYAANSSANTVSMYSRDVSSGLLTALASPTIAAGNGPRAITVSPDGAHLYVTNLSGNSISMYSRNTSTGQLTALATPTIATPTGPIAMAISQDGASVYVTHYSLNQVSMYSRNTSTGQLTALATPTIAAGSNPRGVVVSSDGKSVYVSNLVSNSISMYSRNTSTGQLTALATPTIAAGAASSMNTLAISPDGKSVYGASAGASGTVSMYSRDSATSMLTIMGTPTIGTGYTPNSMVVSPDGEAVFVASSSSNNVAMYTRNISSGMLTATPTPLISTVGNSVFGICITPDGKSVYVTDNMVTGYINMYKRN